MAVRVQGGEHPVHISAVGCDSVGHHQRTCHEAHGTSHRIGANHNAEREAGHHQ